MLARYIAALQLIDVIAHNQRIGRTHYRRNSGRLLTELDEVIVAILADDLMDYKTAQLKTPNDWLMSVAANEC